MYPWYVLTGYAVLTALIAVPSPVSAQHEAVVHGTVVDARTDEPLAGAHVLLEDTPHGVAADADGSYRLEDIAAGSYVVRASYVGYATLREEITLEAGEHFRLDLELEPDDVAFGELIVTGEVQEEERAVGVSRVPVQFVHDLPAVMESDVFRSLQLLPGIQAASDYSSGLYIRGGSPDQTLVRLDGATLYNPTHAFGFYSTFNPDALDAVDVYKGSYPARFGGRLGSVVDIETREGRTDRTAGGLTIGLLASRAFIEGPIGNGSYLLAVRRSTLEPILSALNRADFDGIPERFHFYDINTRLSYDFSSRDNLSLSLYAGSDALIFPFLDEEASFDVTYGNQVGSLHWTHTFSDRLMVRVGASASRYFADPIASITATRVEQENRVEEVIGRGALSWDVNDHRDLEAGLEVGRVGVTVHNAFDGETTVDHRDESAYVAGYLQETLRPTTRWKIRAGLRVHYFERGDYVRVGPRLTIEHYPLDALDVRAGYGRYYQFMGLETNETMSAFDQWYPSADGLPPAYGDQFVAGVLARLNTSFTVEVEGFVRTMRDLFRVNPFLPDRTELAYEESFLTGEGLAYGAELLLRRDEGRLHGYVGYTLGMTRRSFEGINDGEWYPPKYDRTHDLTVVANLDLSAQWRLTSVFRYATGQAYSPAMGQYRMVDEPLIKTQGPGRVPVINAGFNTGRMPPYHRLDLGVTRTGQLFGSVGYELQAQVINVYQQRNVWFYFFDVDTAGEPEQLDIPQIPVMVPSLSLSLQF